MASDTFTLVAVDDVGGQALFTRQGRWFRIAAEEEWEPQELPDERAAMRCTLVAPFTAREQDYPSLASLTDSVRSAWASAAPLDDIPLELILHLLPPAVQRAWRRGRDFHANEAQFLSSQFWRAREEYRQREKPRREGYEKRNSYLPIYFTRELPRRWDEPVDVPLWVEIYETAAELAHHGRSLPYPVAAFDADDLASEAALTLIRDIQIKPETRESIQKDHDPIRFLRPIMRSIYRSSFARQSHRRETVSIERDPPIDPEPLWKKDWPSSDPAIQSWRRDAHAILHSALESYGGNQVAMQVALQGLGFDGYPSPEELLAREFPSLQDGSPKSKLRLKTKIRGLKKSFFADFSHHLKQLGYDFEDLSALIDVRAV